MEGRRVKSVGKGKGDDGREIWKKEIEGSEGER